MLSAVIVVPWIIGPVFPEVSQNKQAVCLNKKK